MIYEVISAVAISVTISFIMSIGIAYLMHRKIDIKAIHGLQVVLDGKADTRHVHHKDDIIDVGENFPTVYGEPEYRDEP